MSNIDLSNMNFNNALYLVMIIALLYIIIRIFSRPIKLIIKLIFNAAFGLLLLYLYNKFGAGHLGITLPFNWFNIVMAGTLGVPGVILLLLINFFA